MYQYYIQLCTTPHRDHISAGLLYARALKGGRTATTHVVFQFQAISKAKVPSRRVIYFLLGKTGEHFMHGDCECEYNDTEREIYMLKHLDWENASLYITSAPY